MLRAAMSATVFLRATRSFLPGCFFCFGFANDREDYRGSIVLEDQ